MLQISHYDLFFIARVQLSIFNFKLANTSAHPTHTFVIHVNSVTMCNQNTYQVYFNITFIMRMTY